MDATSGEAAPDPQRGTPPERRGAGRSRGEAGHTSRVPDDARRKRGSPPRYVAWGDEIERAYCVRAVHRLPTAFPVQSRSGVATIPATVVARRADALLLCDSSHAGPHVWPDGETINEDGETASEEPSDDRRQ